MRDLQPTAMCMSRKHLDVCGRGIDTVLCSPRQDLGFYLRRASHKKWVIRTRKYAAGRADFPVRTILRLPRPLPAGHDPALYDR
jgi:hypothetical protein